jgi:hypothetical protein
VSEAVIPAVDGILQNGKGIPLVGDLARTVGGIPSEEYAVVVLRLVAAKLLLQGVLQAADVGVLLSLDRGELGRDRYAQLGQVGRLRRVGQTVVAQNVLPLRVVAVLDSVGAAVYLLMTFPFGCLPESVRLGGEC